MVNFNVQSVPLQRDEGLQDIQKFVRKSPVRCLYEIHIDGEN